MIMIHVQKQSNKSQLTQFSWRQWIKIPPLQSYIMCQVRLEN